MSGCSGLDEEAGEKETAVTEAAEAAEEVEVAAEAEETAVYRPETTILNPEPGLPERPESELSEYEKYPSSEAPVYEGVEFDKNSLRFSEIFSDFDTVTANPEAFRKAAEDGTIEIYLRGRVFELEFDVAETFTPKIIMENESGIYTEETAPISNYRGKVAGIEDSRVAITVGENVVIGSIRIGYEESYCIEQTNRTQEGKVIHVVYSSADRKPREFTEYPEL
ncbi:hypothetical protein ACSAZK_00630 [Methanosarcina sp. Mfa9]|uniref:hypothetical protein n=1 Tax=Methanosarcina sp. Mfa9 TaxID=3439063 RepID=UPI003F846181